MKKTALIIFAIIVVAGIVFLALSSKGEVNNSQCKFGSLIFYYLDECEWCNKVKSEGTLDSLEALGVKVQKINTRTGIVRHSFTGVPTFVVDNTVYTGYRTLDELKDLLGCPKQ